MTHKPSKLKRFLPMGLDASAIPPVLNRVMKRKPFNPLLLVALTLVLNACRYSNEFTGKFGETAATLTAFSKNTDKYCIALKLTAGAETRRSFISASSVFDASDLTRTKAFNTKNEPCSANLDEYLVGTRSTKVTGTRIISRMENLNSFLCQVVYYNEYGYTDEIQFDFRNKLSDLATGTFSGAGQVQYYVDFSRPINFGPVFRCNGNNWPYPPYPYPYPPFPRDGFLPH
ncbi:MAG: hypothetical protein KGP28_07710 [Bdellovibrionales bacterium]|nr:hypothetical protein [Bdellovibrionales bacterium]